MQDKALSVGGAAPTLFVEGLGGGRCPHPSTAPQVPEDENLAKEAWRGSVPAMLPKQLALGQRPQR